METQKILVGFFGYTSFRTHDKGAEFSDTKRSKRDRNMGPFTEALEKVFLSVFEAVSGKLKTISGVFVFAIITLLNQLGTHEYFECPHEGYLKAGLLFLIAPACILLFLILIASNSLREASIRCFKWKKTQSKWCKYRPVCCSMGLFNASLLAFGYGALACLSWVVATLMFTDTWSCLKLGPAPTAEKGADAEIFKSKKGIQDAFSKTLGLIILICAVGGVMVVYFAYTWCCAELSEIDGPLKCMARYDELEVEAKKDAFEELMLINSKNVALEELGTQIPHEVAQIIRDNSGSSMPSSNDASAEGTAEIAKGSIIAREKIEEIRNALVNQHPRLENPFDKRLPLRQEQRGAEHN